MNSDRNEEAPSQPKLLVSDAPNVVTLVRVCGRPYAVWRDQDGQVRFREVTRRA